MRPLETFHDPNIPKINNLQMAQANGISVPQTVWMYAADVSESNVHLPTTLQNVPVIIRSASPTEDTRQTSNAGQLLSLVVKSPEELQAALQKVVLALPVDSQDRRTGAVFVQPFLIGEEAGVAFTDGFYFEQTTATGENTALTGGLARGEVRRGHLQREEAWSEWLNTLYHTFGIESGGDLRLDIEYVRQGGNYILLQIRPALFPLVRNETLSLANHKEILGDPPSPWIVSVLGDAGEKVMRFFAGIDPAVSHWQESYAVVLGERAWMNFSVFFRLMDRWGLPRTWVTEGVGGETTNAADSRFLWKRTIRAVPRLIRLQLVSLVTVLKAGKSLQKLDRQIENASDLPALYQANVAAMETGIQTNFAINGILSGISRVRRLLRLPNAGRVITQQMMESYSRFPSISDVDVRQRELDNWLLKYGHRGPLESDPARPRFSELRETLLRDLASYMSSPAPSAPKKRLLLLFLRPLFLIDERREWFRDELMRRWQKLRQKLLAEGDRLVAEGSLEYREEVFLLRGEDMERAKMWRTFAEHNRKAVDAVRGLRLPLTASREEIEAALREQSNIQEKSEGQNVFSGISLSSLIIEGRAVKATDLLSLLERSGKNPDLLTSQTILVVPALEPSWAVVFPRVGGVVAEIGGELSHASILLREAGKPAIVNCTDIFPSLRDGDMLRLDGQKGRVHILSQNRSID